MIKIRELGRDFWVFRFGQFVADLGYHAAHLALVWWAISQTNSAASLGILLTSHALAVLIFKPVIAPYGDRCARRKLVMIGNVLQSLVLIIIGRLIYLGDFTISYAVCFMVFLAIAQSISSAGSNSIVTQLVEKDQFVHANASVQVLKAAASILGGVAGSLIIAMWGNFLVFLCSAIGFCFASITAGLIRKNTQSRSVSSRMSLANWATDLSEGFSCVWAIKVLLGIVFVFSIMNLLLAPLSIIIPHTIKADGLSSVHLGFVQGALGVGVVTGSLLIPSLLKNVDQSYLVIFSIVGLGCAFVIAGICRSYIGLIVCMALATFFTSCINVVFYSRVMSSLPDHYRSRVSSILELTATVAAPVALVFGGIFIDYLGGWQTFVIIGAGVLFLAPVLPFLPSYFVYFGVSPEDSYNWFMNKYPNVFRK